MKIHWPQYHLQLICTEDQSPSLQVESPVPGGTVSLGEAMHHSGGAYSETQQIYGDPLRSAIGEGRRSVISVGLGLGYNEILVAFEALRAQISPKNFFLLSFESEPILRDHFIAWTESQDEGFVYDQIFEFFQNSKDLPTSEGKQDLKNWLREARALGSWQLESALLPSFTTHRKYEVIFYDVFSAKTSPQLWEEKFLTAFFEEVSAADALVASYACTGSLTRALKKAGFKSLPKKGFHGKRNSTLAYKTGS